MRRALSNGSKRSPKHPAVMVQGSSAIAQARSQKVEDPEENMEEMDQGPSEVTRLRPYTSLYIPPRSQRPFPMDADPIRRRSQSVPRPGLLFYAPL